ncbi:glycosyltransferase [Sphingomonas sp. GlSt437]|uniref:glycosyltransferase n=1 Tax=Sphingomonas sp. GlSt437 TaxID=3389970 RepID=UPI003A85FDF0
MLESAAPISLPHLATPELSLVVPSYNERANIAPLVAAVGAALGDIAWEILIVDDDSPDRTWEEVGRIAMTDPRVRCLRRVGRRGLASAVIEGAMAANGAVIAVMDADFQHDETILPAMYAAIAAGADVAVGTRYALGGGTGEWDERRVRMSSFATRIARALIGNRTTDPMSGFFMARRDVFAASIYNLSNQGFKILLDLLASYPGKLKVVDVPYTFRNRRAGDSKISPMVIAEFAFLLIEKLSRGLVSPRFVLFALVGGLGLIVHLLVLSALIGLKLNFLPAQVAALLVAIVFNYAVNNEFTYRDRRLTGMDFVGGLVVFAIICSIGAIANIGVANLAVEEHASWSIAGVAGAVMSAVFNFGGTSSLVWGRRRWRSAS